MGVSSDSVWWETNIRARRTLEFWLLCSNLVLPTGFVLGIAELPSAIFYYETTGFHCNRDSAPARMSILVYKCWPDDIFTIDGRAWGHGVDQHLTCWVREQWILDLGFCLCIHFRNQSAASYNLEGLLMNRGHFESESFSSCCILTAESVRLPEVLICDSYPLVFTAGTMVHFLLFCCQAIVNGDERSSSELHVLQMQKMAGLLLLLLVLLVVLLLFLLLCGGGCGCSDGGGCGCCCGCGIAVFVAAVIVVVAGAGSVVSQCVFVSLMYCCEHFVWVLSLIDATCCRLGNDAFLRKCLLGRLLLVTKVLQLRRMVSLGTS